jgi:hypothetical protein
MAHEPMLLDCKKTPQHYKTCPGGKVSMNTENKVKKKCAQTATTIK